MHELRLKPLDPVFFRDGKPFTMGDDTWADSRMLPNPSVLYGALRTALATANGIDLVDIEHRIKPENFQIKNIFYRADGKTFFPLPLDMVYNPEKKKSAPFEIQKLSLEPSKTLVSSLKRYDIEFLLRTNDHFENLDSGVFEFTELQNYLNGSERLKAYKLSDFIISEPKIGNGRENDTRNVLEGSLYRTGMFRYETYDDGFAKPVEIVCQINLNEDLEMNNIESNLVRLGGEGKLISIGIQDANRNYIQPVSEIEFKENRFKVYFSTPAVFKKFGWKPDLEQLGIKAKLVASCIGKPIPIGGYNIIKGPKPMYRAVPAGSVYYYEADEDVSGILNQNQGVSLSEVSPEQGYGIAYFAKF